MQVENEGGRVDSARNLFWILLMIQLKQQQGKMTKGMQQKIHLFQHNLYPFILLEENRCREVTVVPLLWTAQRRGHRAWPTRCSSIYSVLEASIQKDLSQAYTSAIRGGVGTVKKVRPIIRFLTPSSSFSIFCFLNSAMLRQLRF